METGELEEEKRGAGIRRRNVMRKKRKRIWRSKW